MKKSIKACGLLFATRRNAGWGAFVNIEHGVRRELFSSVTGTWMAHRELGSITYPIPLETHGATPQDAVSKLLRLEGLIGRQLKK